MNKKIENTISQLGFNVTGNNAYGIYEGFEVNISYNLMSRLPLTIQISTFIAEEKWDSFFTTLKNAKIKYCNFTRTCYGLLVCVTDVTAGAMAKNLKSKLDIIINYIKGYDGLNANYCPVCGSKLNDLNKLQVNDSGFIIGLDQDCKDRINEEILNRNEAYDNQPNNYLQGFGCALLGGAIAAILSFILYLMGFISAIPALVGITLGAYFYKKFGGKVNRNMVFIVTGTMIVCLVGILLIIYLLASKAYAINAGYDYTSFKAFSYALDNVEGFREGFIRDFIMTIFFIILGAGYEVYLLSKQVRNVKDKLVK